jgi:hypothetical protein
VKGSSSTSSPAATSSTDVLAYEPAPAIGLNLNRLLLLGGAADALCVLGQFASLLLRDATYVRRVDILGAGVLALHGFALVVCVAALAGRMSIRTVRNCLGGFVVTLLVLETFAYIGGTTPARQWSVHLALASSRAQPLVWPVVLVIALRPDDRTRDASRSLLIAGLIVSIVVLLRGVGMMIYLLTSPVPSFKIMTLFDVCGALLAAGSYALALRRPEFRRASAIGACALLVGMMVAYDTTRLKSASSTATLSLNWIWQAALMWLTWILWVVHAYFVPIMLVVITHRSMMRQRPR